MTPEIALAASARDWPDRLHRFLLDHGGGVVVGRVMSPEQALETSFDVLFIDDICSFLTPRLVTGLRRAGKEAVGVFDPDDGPDAKRRLLECGISDVLEFDATPLEFIDAALAAMSHKPTPDESAPARTRSFSIGVCGTTDGVGATETAVGVAGVVSGSLSTVLVDLDMGWPSVAQRLDLGLHPNLRSALDAVVHGTAGLTDALHMAGDLSIVVGVADSGSAGPVPATEALALIEDLGALSEVVVCDLGPLDRAIPGVVRAMDSLIIVGAGDPVGVTRLHRTMERLSDLVDAERILLAVNQVPPGGFNESEIRRELAQSWPGSPVVLLPLDRRVSEAAWEGRRLKRGRLHQAFRRIGGLIIEEVARDG